MDKVCVKCGYERQERDSAANEECPHCGVIYSKAVAPCIPSKPYGSTADKSSENDLISLDISDEIGLYTKLSLYFRQLSKLKVTAFVITLIVFVFAVVLYENSQSPASIKGEIFVSTRGRENIRLGAVEVNAYSANEMEYLIRRQRSSAIAEEETLQQRVKSADLLSLYEYRDELISLIKFYKTYLENPYEYKAETLLKPIASSVTDSNGNFSIKLPPGSYIVSAQTNRLVFFGGEEKYRWMLYVNTTTNQDRIILTNNNILNIEANCKYCVEPIFGFTSIVEKVLRTKTSLEDVNKRIHDTEVAIALAKGEEIRRQNERVRNEIRLDRLERRAALIADIDSLAKKIPDFDAIYRPAPECRADNIPMPELLVCGRARASAKTAYDNKYLNQRLKLEELKRELAELQKL
ncbi:hypothetical protein [Dechloromonas sp. A34]|uniref:hypothetical protein n=1 Tax=Dechloromonas sp. A34 TaxID=447588 RepID=UPI002248FA62|nr:hypothetical protein [Dechloromonas sp. A34]